MDSAQPDEASGQNAQASAGGNSACTTMPGLQCLERVHQITLVRLNSSVFHLLLPRHVLLYVLTHRTTVPYLCEVVARMSLQMAPRWNQDLFLVGTSDGCGFVTISRGNA